MPAIHLTRLKVQSVRLADHFAQPEEFLLLLHEMLELYTNRTLRHPRSTRSTSLASYRTPPPVMHQILNELAPLADRQPENAAALVTKLWRSESIEARLLAARLLGHMPLEAARHLHAQVPAWLAKTPEAEICAALLGDAFSRMRTTDPGRFLSLLESWLKSARTSLQSWGLQALVPWLAEAGEEILPSVFRILEPAVRAAGPVTQLELKACLAALERLSPQETLAFLRRLVGSDPPASMLRTLQRLLPAFSPQTQAALRPLLRPAAGSK